MGETRCRGRSCVDVCRRLARLFSRRRFAATAIAALNLLIWSAAAAPAQPAGSPCATLESALTGQPDALRYFASQPSPFDVVLSSTRAAGGNSASLTFEGAQIAAIKDVSTICVEGFVDGHMNRPVRIERVFLNTPDNGQQNLQIVFRVWPIPGNWLYGRANYTFVGSLAGLARPFSYSADITVANKATTALVTLVLLLVAYVLLAYATYDSKDADGVRGIRWLIYAASPVRITAGAFGDASLSQVQVILFTFVVAGLLFQLWLRTGVLSNISTQLLYLLGISAVGAGGAKFTGTIKTGLSDSTAQYLIGKGWYSWPLKPLRQHATFANLLLTDGRLDVYKFQMAIFTVVVAAYVVSAGQSDLSNVNISDTMLYLIGISQGVYVGGKAVTDRTTDLESAVAKMIGLDGQIQALQQKIHAAPPPANSADLLNQRDELITQYEKAARTAVKEFAPLTHRQYPQAMDGDQPKIDPLDGQPAISPAVLQPSVP